MFRYMKAAACVRAVATLVHVIRAALEICLLDLGNMVIHAPNLLFTSPGCKVAACFRHARIYTYLHIIYANLYYNE